MNDKTGMTFRFTTKDKEAIEILKDFTRENTSSKAVLTAIHKYPGTVSTLIETQAALDDALRVMRNFLHCQDSHADALEDLRGLQTNRPDGR